MHSLDKDQHQIILSFNNVSVCYPNSTIATINNCCLDLLAGQRLALLGLNGTGKTTLLLVPVGLVPFSGQVQVTGIDVDKKTLSTIRRKIGFLFSVPDNQILFPRVIDDVLLSLQNNKMDYSKAAQTAYRILELLEISELAEENPCHLSDGQRVKVALAGALANNPELLLLDEPSAMLDPIGKIKLARYLNQLKMSMIIATHDLEFARTCCTHFVVLKNSTFSEPPKIISELPKNPNQIWPDQNIIKS